MFVVCDTCVKCRLKMNGAIDRIGCAGQEASMELDAQFQQCFNEISVQHSREAYADTLISVHV